MLNFDQICRLCLLEVRNNLNIFESTDPVCSLSARIMALAEVEIAEDDMMPHLICLSCYSKVEQYHVFKTQIEKSDSILRQELVKSTALESGAQLKTELTATDILTDGSIFLQQPQPNTRLNAVGQRDDICPPRASKQGHDDVGKTEEIITNSMVSRMAVVKPDEITAEEISSKSEVKNSDCTIYHESRDISAEISVCSTCSDLDCVSSSDNCNEENGHSELTFIGNPDNSKDDSGCNDFVFEVVVFSQNDEALSKDSSSEQDITVHEADAQLNPTYPTMVSSISVYKEDIKCIPITNVADITLFSKDDLSALFHCGACKKVFMSHFHLARHKEEAHPNLNMVSGITPCKEDTKGVVFSQTNQTWSKNFSSEVDLADEGNVQLNHLHSTIIPSITICKDNTEIILLSQKDQAQCKDSLSEIDTADGCNAQFNPIHQTIIPSTTTCKDDTKSVLFSSLDDQTPSKDFSSEQDTAAQENVQLNPVQQTIVSGTNYGTKVVVFSHNDQTFSEDLSIGQHIAAQEVNFQLNPVQQTIESGIKDGQPNKALSTGQHIVAQEANAQLSPIHSTVVSSITTYKGVTKSSSNTNVADIPSFVKDDPSALFPCDVCRKVFMSHFYLVRHKEQAHKKTRQECDVCKMTFYSKYTLRDHKRMHTVDQLHRCVVCPETFTKSSELSAHKLTHKQSFVCKLCGMAFIERKVYIEHRIKHKGEMTHVCTNCNKAFADKTALFLHSTIHNVDKQHYSCPDCGDVFNQRSYLVRHHKRRHRKTNSGSTNASASPTLNTGGEDCNSEKSSLNILEHSEGAVKKINSNIDMSDTNMSINIDNKCVKNAAFVCHICGKRSANKLKMASHMRVHTGERPYKCDLCPKAYKEIGHLTYHLMAQHEKLNFKCNMCEKVFRTSVSFSQHQIRHGAAKTHVCAHCKRAFYSDYDLEIHMLTHTQLKSYKCKECGALLRTRRYFEHHFRTFHKGISISYPDPDPSEFKFSIPASEEDLTCAFCGKRFSCRSKVIDHTRTHTGERPYVCNICHKSYTQQGHLREHNRSAHNNVISPYRCDICGAVFKVRSTFQLHQLKHDGVKSHLCMVCNKAFYTSYLLKNHTRAAHEEKRFSCQFCDRLFHSKPLLIRHLRQLHKVKVSNTVPC